MKNSKAKKPADSKIEILETPEKTKFKKRDILETFVAIQSLPKAKSARVQYAFEKNKRLILPIVESLEESKKPSDEYVTYDLERVGLCKKFSLKDAKGESVTFNRDFVIDPSRKNEFDAALNKLKEEHKKSVDEYDEKLKEYSAMLEEKEVVNYHKVALSNVEDAYDDMPQNIMAAIFDMIEED